jgi:hypothetical protein
MMRTLSPICRRGQLNPAASMTAWCIAELRSVMRGLQPNSRSPAASGRHDEPGTSGFRREQFGNLDSVIAERKLPFSSSFAALTSLASLWMTISLAMIVTT